MTAIHTAGGPAQAGSAPSGRRIAGLDSARALAIALALLSHCFIHFGVWSQLGEESGQLLRALTRSATPTFIILFGMMLEIVYLKMLQRGNRQGCWLRLSSRAIQCYLLYLCVVAAGILGGKLSPSEGLKAGLFLSEAYFANILKFYSLGLIAGILLVELRARFGLRAVALFFLAIWACYPLIKALPPPPEGLAQLASFLIGAGAETGPAVLQGMSLAALGMFLGNAARDATFANGDRQRAVGLIALLGLLAVAATTALLLAEGGRAIEGFTTYAYRAANHPGYYILGGTFAFALIGVCVLVAARLPDPLLGRLNVFGTSSLFAYACGNVVLNLLPPLRGDLALGLACSLVFLLGLYGVTLYFQRTVRAEATGGHSMAARLGRLHGGLRDFTARLAALFVVRIVPGNGPRLDSATRG